MAMFDLKNATITLKDGGVGTAQNSLVMKLGEGTLTVTEKRPIEFVRDRGVLDYIRLADEEPMDVRFDVVFEYYTAQSVTGANPTPADALKGEGAASAWVTASDDACEPYVIDIEVDNAVVCGTGKTAETLTLPDFAWEQMDFDLKAGTLSVTGRCNATSLTAVRYNAT